MRTITAAVLFLALTAGASAEIVARIDISRQTMTVSQNGRVVYVCRLHGEEGLSYSTRDLRREADAQNVVSSPTRDLADAALDFLLRRLCPSSTPASN